MTKTPAIEEAKTSPHLKYGGIISLSEIEPGQDGGRSPGKTRAYFLSGGPSPAAWTIGAGSWGRAPQSFREATPRPTALSADLDASPRLRGDARGRSQDPLQVQRIRR
jgi:hypothetical protein